MNKFALFIMSLIVAFTVFFSVRVNASELIHVSCGYQHNSREFTFDTIEGGEYKVTGVVFDMNTTFYIKNTSKFSEVDDYALFEKNEKKVLFVLKCVKVVVL